MYGRHRAYGLKPVPFKAKDRSRSFARLTPITTYRDRGPKRAGSQDDSSKDGAQTGGHPAGFQDDGELSCVAFPLIRQRRPDEWGTDLLAN